PSPSAQGDQPRLRLCRCRLQPRTAGIRRRRAYRSPATVGALSRTGWQVGLGKDRPARHPVHRPPGHAEIGRLMDFLVDGPKDASTTILLAHGAGASMDSASMNAIAGALGGAGFRVARFEFGYMASRRTS